MPVDGRYEVRVSYAAHGNRAATAGVTVQHADGKSTQRIDQRKKPPIAGLFLSLGEFRFEKGKPAQVVFTTQAARGTVIADAVQLLSAEDRKQLANRKSAKKKAPKQAGSKRAVLMKGPQA